MEIILREWNLDDLNNLVKYANNINIANNLTNAFPYPYTENEGRNYINFANKEIPLRVFAITLNNEAVGSIGIFPQQDVHCKNAEIGYWLAEPYWGKGIITDAINKIVEYGFNTFDINRIFARPFGTNLASQRALEKNGFVLEAHLNKTLYKNGEYLDELIYGKIRSGN